jgi:hypothetical protein
LILALQNKRFSEKHPRGTYQGNNYRLLKLMIKIHKKETEIDWFTASDPIKDFPGSTLPRFKNMFIIVEIIEGAWNSRPV